jgi:glycine/D-amino acid oxidase-like deaminating enzyme
MTHYPMVTLLPILDLGEADADPTSFRTALRKAAHRHGFFYLTGHGVPAAQVDEGVTTGSAVLRAARATNNEISPNPCVRQRLARSAVPGQRMTLISVAGSSAAEDRFNDAFAVSSRYC